MRFALQAVRPLDSYCLGRVVLLGDAVSSTFSSSEKYAYKMPIGTRNATASRCRSRFSPRGENHQWQSDLVHKSNPSQDSYILASLLASSFCTKSTIPDVANVYDAIRRPAANRVVELSRLAGRLCQINTPGFEDVTEHATVEFDRLRKLVDTIAKNWEWSWAESAEDEKDRAIEMLALNFTKESTTNTVPVPLVTTQNHHSSTTKSLRSFFFFLLGITASTALALAYFIRPTLFINVWYLGNPL